MVTTGVREEHGGGPGGVYGVIGVIGVGGLLTGELLSVLACVSCGKQPCTLCD